MLRYVIHRSPGRLSAVSQLLQQRFIAEDTPVGRGAQREVPADLLPLPVAPEYHRALHCLQSTRGWHDTARSAHCVRGLHPRGGARGLGGHQLCKGQHRTRRFSPRRAAGGLLHDSFVDPAEGGKWKLWTDRQAGFDIPKDAPYHTVMVPTSATVHNQFLIRVVIEQGFNTCPTAPRVRRRSPPSRACCGRASTRTSTARWLRLLGSDSGEPVPGHH